ncbi:MAG: family 16 glycoside hydrolase [Planctomycetaceae bacterium]
MKSVLILILVSSIVGTAHAAEPTPPAGFRALFNGKDLVGWYGLNPHSVEKLTGEKRETALKQMRDEFASHWRIENSELVNDGHGPYATPDAELGDLELLIEYKTVAKADSGIYLRGLSQVQIWDISQPSLHKAPDRNPNRGSGGLFNNLPRTPGRDPLVVADKPFGDWNSFRIRQIGVRTWVWLNEQLVVDDAVMQNYANRSQPLPARGPIHLQTHGGEIRWRNIFVRDIGSDEALKILSEADVKAKATLADKVLIERGVRYLADGRDEQADLYVPLNRDEAARSPAVVIIHGGGWTGGKRDAARELNIGTTLAANGYVGMSIDYLLATDDKPSWPQNIHDCKTAVRWLRANAKRLQIDPDHIGVIGGSAGGHLTALLALTGPADGLDPSEPWGEFSCAVQCAVPMYGAGEVRDGKSAKAMLGKLRDEAPDLYKLASPITHADAKDPPFLILHGTADKTVPVEQSEILAAALKNAGVEHELVLVPDAPHTFDLQPKQQDLRPLVLKFFDKHLKR